MDKNLKTILIKKSEDLGFHYIIQPSDAQRALLELENSKELALDTETYVEPKWKGIIQKALSPHTSNVSILTLQGRETKPYVFDCIYLNNSGYDFNQLFTFLQQRKWLLAHNAKFDAKFLYKLLGKWLYNWRCTFVSALLLTNATSSKYAKLQGHTLEDLLRDWLSISIQNKRGKDTPRVTDWLPRPEHSQQVGDWLEKLSYASNDVKYLFDLHDFAYSVIHAPPPQSPLYDNGVDDRKEKWGLDMGEVYKLEMRFIAVVAEMEWVGLPISNQMNEEFVKESYHNVYLKAASELCTYFNLDTYDDIFQSEFPIPTDGSLRILNNPNKLRDLIVREINVSIDSVQAKIINRLVDVLDTLSTNGDVYFMSNSEESAYQEILQLEESQVVKYCKLAKLVAHYKRMSKLIGTKLGSFIDPATNRIHAHYSACGTATGRSSSSDPNAQNISSRTHIRTRLHKDDLYHSSSLPAENLHHARL